MQGILTALTAGVLLGLFQWLLGKNRELPVRTATVVLLALATVIVNVLTVATLGVGAYAALSLRALGLFALAGVVHFAFGWMSTGMSQRQVGVGVTGVLIGTTPVFTAVIAWVFLGELLSTGDIIGIGLVVLGVGIVTWK